MGAADPAAAAAAQIGASHADTSARTRSLPVHVTPVAPDSLWLATISV